MSCMPPRYTLRKAMERMLVLRHSQKLAASVLREWQVQAQYLRSLRLKSIQLVLRCAAAHSACTGWCIAGLRSMQGSRAMV